MCHVIRGISVAALVLMSGLALGAPGDAPTGDASAEDPAVVAPNQVYKSVDAKGHTVFTDSPPVGKSSEPVVVQPANSIPMGSIAPQPRNDKSGDGDAEKKKGSVSYTRIDITSPTNDEVIGQDVDSATIAVVLEPPLQAGHTIQIYFDGNPVSAGSFSYTVSPLERGTHTAQAKVFDNKGKELKASGTVQFHVRRISSLNKVSEKDVVPAKRPSLLAVLLGRGKPKPPAEPTSGFGSMKGFGSPGGSGSIVDAKTGGGVRSASNVRAAKDAH